ncbi:MAG: hypothetical protein KKA62_03575 [Nanoarchaeota archaeon]|nr:hypothetical protein [Nanoarchaeota archaeon]MBU1643783.1 hypothetical protein [Nanoarchaeota archaeon]MBU1977005.1 hypothetical protein [Nanoarchaeota archaeon]
MGKRYDSIDQFFKKDKEWIAEELNGHPYYYGIVKFLGFKEIGIIVLDEEDLEIGRYASHNGNDGKIYEIEPYFVNPDLSVRVKETVLLDIIENREDVKAHPVRSFFRYQNHFSMRPSQKIELVKRVLGFGIVQ